MEFTAPLEATGGTTTGFVVPDALVDELGGGRRPKVVATVGGHSWRTSIAAMGGQFWLGVSAANRAEAGIAAGETHTVAVELDTAPRTVDVPDDLATALAAAPGADGGVGPADLQRAARPCRGGRRGEEARDAGASGRGGRHRAHRVRSAPHRPTLGG